MQSILRFNKKNSETIVTKNRKGDEDRDIEGMKRRKKRGIVVIKIRRIIERDSEIANTTNSTYSNKVESVTRYCTSTLYLYEFIAKRQTS